MSMINDSAICLRCWDYSETSQTVALLTQQHGLIRGIAKGSKRDRGSFSGGFDPLTQGNIVARSKANSDLATLTEWNLESVWWTTRNNLEVNKCAIYMTDLVMKMITDQDPHTQIFESFKQALQRIDSGHDLNWPLLRFQWALLVESGYQPRLDDVQNLPDIVGFSPTKGSVVEDTGEIDRVRVRKETIDVLHMIGDDSPTQTVNPEVLNRANRLLAHYLRHIIGSESAAMRWMWGSISS